MRTSFIILLLCLVGVYSNPWTSSYSSPSDFIYVSTNSITSADFSTLSPSLDSSYQVYTQEGGPFGYMGPLGPFGPLGLLGPIGDNSWNVSQMVSGIDWSQYSQFITIKGGLLSKDGPLGYKGPLNADIYTGKIEPGKSLFENNSFAQHLRALGVFSSLGPIGPLGALGPLGPLGPIGGHGFKATSDGQFVNNQGQVQRTITVDYDGQTKRTYCLFEAYTSQFAKKNSKVLDTSFMILGTVDDFDSSKLEKYTFISNDDQIVTIVVIPEKSLDDFSLGVYDQNGKLIATSDNFALVETITIKAKKGQKLTASIKLSSSEQILSKTYRLIVTGSTSYLNANNFSGNHQYQYYQGPQSSKFGKNIKVNYLRSA
ncbi:hypothetical protein ABPG72_000529 [Tetrahymena utriculariae]